MVGSALSTSGRQVCAPTSLEMDLVVTCQYQSQARLQCSSCPSKEGGFGQQLSTQESVFVFSPSECNFDILEDFCCAENSKRLYLHHEQELLATCLCDLTPPLTLTHPPW